MIRPNIQAFDNEPNKMRLKGNYKFGNVDETASIQGD